jgi:hypothetical protein
MVENLVEGHVAPAVLLIAFSIGTISTSQLSRPGNSQSIPQNIDNTALKSSLLVAAFKGLGSLLTYL